jgi:predicted anti-sigma-YlaC factor YlaD
MTSARHVAAEHLSEWLAGDMPDRDAAVVRAHLAACEACTAIVAELRVETDGLRDLGRPEPPPTLWSTIEGALEAEERGRWSWPSWLMGAVAGAVTAAVVAWLVVGGGGAGTPLTGGAMGGSGAQDDEDSSARTAPLAAAATAAVGADPLLAEAEHELDRAAASYATAAARLRAILDREQALWDPATRARVAERLARLDDAIVHSRAVAQRDPGDGASAEMLFSAYRRQIDFLAEAVHRGSPGAEEGLR